MLQPSVVRLYDHDSRFLALYMENIDAPALDRYPCYNMTVTDQARVLHDMSTALYYIHQQGFVHNDIKPGNILFSRNRGAVLIDFGLSSELTDRTVHTGGTPWYIPPEFTGDRGQRGTPGDVFALGVVMLYVLGRLPLPERHPAKLQWNIFESLNLGSEAAATMESWIRIVQDASRGIDSALSSRLEKLVSGMVTSDPAQRITLGRLVEESSTLPSPRSDAE